MYNNNLNAYNQLPEFDGLTFKVDPFTEKKLDNIFPILFEEQPITWLFFREEITEVLAAVENKSALDVGCGSGFWALMLKKNFPHCKIFAIDKNAKAMDYLEENAINNGIEEKEIEKLNQTYCKTLYPKASFDLIVLIPPYHLYCPENEGQIPCFAAGGENGYAEFYSQLEIARDHLKENGMILFNQMCLGGEENPEFVQKIEELFTSGSLEYYNILEPLASKDFLDTLYPDGEISEEEKKWKDGLKNKFSKLFYTSGVIYKRGKTCRFTVSSKTCDWKSGEAERWIKNHHYITNQPTWEDRINLHKDINKFMKNEQ